VLAKRKHKPLLLIIHLLNIPFIAYLAWVGDASSACFLAIILFMAYAYSVPGLRFKERAGLDSLTSAFHYTSPFIFGVLLAGGTELFLPGWIAFFLWAASNHAFGAIQDIKPDKKAGIRSVATRFGAEKVLIFCLSAYSVAAALPLIFYGLNGLPVSLALLAYVALVWRTVPYRAHDTNPVFHRSWQRLTYMNYICGGLISMYLIYMVGIA
jgi:4-hydroxybenzoate polyprenyltransferase